MEEQPSLGEYSLDGCTGLTTINYAGTQEQWDAISESDASIPSNATINYNYVKPTE